MKRFSQFASSNQCCSTTTSIRELVYYTRDNRLAGDEEAHETSHKKEFGIVEHIYHPKHCTSEEYNSKGPFF